jgi:hypothetical protein
MPENETKKKWLKKINLILILTGLQWIISIYVNNSMVNTNFGVVKAKSNREMELSVVTQCLLESPSFTTTKLEPIRRIVTSKTWQENTDSVKQLGGASILKYDQNWINQKLAAQDSTQLDLQVGESGWFRKIWKPGPAEKNILATNKNRKFKPLLRLAREVKYQNYILH